MITIKKRKENNMLHITISSDVDGNIFSASLQSEKIDEVMEAITKLLLAETYGIYTIYDAHVAEAERIKRDVQCTGFIDEFNRENKDNNE